MTPTPVAKDTSSPNHASGRAKLSAWKRASFCCVHAVLSLLVRGLSLPSLYRLGRAFGTLEWLVNYKRRRRFARAMEGVLERPPTSSRRRRLTHEFFMRSRCDKLFYLMLDCIPTVRAARLLTISNSSLLDEAISHGNGVYMAMSHHGPQHLAAMLLALQGHKIVGVRDRREGGMRQYVQDRFDRVHPEFQRLRILFADSYPRELYRCFREQYLVGSLMDIGRVRDSRQKVEDVTMFGRKRSFVSGPLRVAIRCGAPVLQAFVIPEENFRYKLEIVEKLVDPSAVEDEEETVARAMKIYASNVEKYIRATPTLMTRI